MATAPTTHTHFKWVLLRSYGDINAGILDSIIFQRICDYYIFGHFPVFPGVTSIRGCFVFRYPKTLREVAEMLGYDYNVFISSEEELPPLIELLQSTDTDCCIHRESRDPNKRRKIIKKN